MRHDYRVIREVSQLYGPKFASDLQAYPFFWISEEAEGCFTSTERRNEHGYKRQYPEYVVDLLDSGEIDNILPFRQFTVMDHDVGWHNIHYQGNGHWDVIICIDRQLRDATGVDVSPGLLMLCKVHVSSPDGAERSVRLGSTDTMEMRLAVDSTFGLISREGVAVGVGASSYDDFMKMLDTEEFKDGMSRTVLTSVAYFLSFFKWAEGLHLVETCNKPTKQDRKTAAKGNKKPWTRGDLPHYIYLDSPRSTGGHITDDLQTDAPTHTVRGHARRAHWRELRHPRFINHPMYGKRIRVRPTWVGSTTWVVGDTIYTVKGEHNVPNGRADAAIHGQPGGQTPPGGRDQHNNFG